MIEREKERERKRERKREREREREREEHKYDYIIIWLQVIFDGELPLNSILSTTFDVPPHSR